MKGFVLAAGLGTRLLPITRHIPKALVPILDRVLADYGLSYLQRTGAREIGINAHHFTQQIRDYGNSRNLTVFEEPEILGTGGYLRALGTFLDEDMLVMNGDALFFGDEGFVSRIIDRHRNGHNLITLLVMRRPDFLDATGLDVENGQITGLGSGGFFFTGCQMVSPEIVSLIKEASIVPVYRELIAAGRLGAEIFNGTWFDCETRSGLLATHRQVSGLDSYVYPGAKIEAGAVVKNSVVYPDGIVRAGAMLESSILFQGEITGGSRLEREIVA